MGIGGNYKQQSIGLQFAIGFNDTLKKSYQRPYNIGGLSNHYRSNDQQQKSYKCNHEQDFQTNKK